MKSSQLQIDLLKRLYGTSATARALLDYATRQTSLPPGDVLTVESLQGALQAEQRCRVGRRELTRTLRTFDKAGCGHFVTGRRGQSSRFVWTLAPAALASAVLGKPATPAPAAAANATTSIPAVPPGMYAHPFRLRPNLVLSLQFPDDFTAEEAERVARFVQALPLKQA